MTHPHPGVTTSMGCRRRDSVGLLVPEQRNQAVEQRRLFYRFG